MNTAPSCIRTAISVVILALSMQVHAQNSGEAKGTPSTSPPDTSEIRSKFARLDVDGDGYLALEEIPKEHLLRTRFTEVDINSDHRLSLAEVAEYDVETAHIE